MDKKTQFLNELFALAQKNKEMFCISNILTEFQMAMSNPDTPIEKIASIIEKDPGLTSSVLKVANSSFYGLSKKVGTVKQAISILGYKALEKIFITQAIKKTFASDNADVTNDLWKHSLVTAIASQLIVSIKQPRLAEQAFIAGLLHDLGKFLLLSFKKQETQLLLNKLEANPSQYSLPLEMIIFDANHQDIGAFFAQQWQFPENVTNCIRYHHSIDFADKDKDFIAAVAVANNIAKAMEIGKSTSGLVELLPHWIWGFIGFKQKTFYNIVSQTKDKYLSLTSYMND